MSKYLRPRYLLPILTLMIIGLYLAIRRPTPLPTISSTSPADNSVGVALLPTITLHFADDLSATPIAISSVPDIPYHPTTILARELSFTPATPLLPNTLYQLSIKSGSAILHQFSFTTKPTQTDQIILDQIHAELKDKYPLANKTPYTTPEYRVIYSAPLTLEITLKTGALAPDAAISQIQLWVKNNGLDPSTHQYLVK